ncbi:hypothetical protein V8C86DRAFT_2593144 [Haematococcus lacustris]
MQSLHARSLQQRCVAPHAEQRRRAEHSLPRAASVASRSAPETLLALHVSGNTTVSIPFTRGAAEDLQTALASVLSTFAAKQKATKPQRWPMLEWRHKAVQGDTSLMSDLALFEVMCNPNAHGTAFEASTLISLRTQAGLRVTTEAKLPSLQADLAAYLSSLQ